MLGFDIANGLAFWTASATAEKDDLRPLSLSLPFCHMKRRSSQVWEEVLGLLATSGVSGAGVSGGGEVEVAEDWELVRGLYVVCLRNMVVVLVMMWVWGQLQYQCNLFEESRSR